MTNIAVLKSIDWRVPGGESNNPCAWTDANPKSVTRRRRRVHREDAIAFVVEPMGSEMD